MKLKSIIVAFLILPLLLSVYGCSNQKRQAVEYAKKYYEFLEKTKDVEKTQAEAENIAKSAGFKDIKEQTAAMSKYADDPEIKQWLEKSARLFEQLAAEKEKKEADEAKRKLEEEEAKKMAEEAAAQAEKNDNASKAADKPAKKEESGNKKGK